MLEQPWMLCLVPHPHRACAQECSHPGSAGGRWKHLALGYFLPITLPWFNQVLLLLLAPRYQDIILD